MRHPPFIPVLSQMKATNHRFDDSTTEIKMSLKIFVA